MTSRHYYRCLQVYDNLSNRGRILTLLISILVSFLVPFLYGLNFTDWLWIALMLNITVLRNEVSWVNCFNGLDKYIP